MFGSSPFSRFTGNSWSIDALLKANDISSEVQTHLSKVYATIGAGILITALGVYCDMLFALSGTLTMIATFAFLLWVMLDSDVANWPKRVAIFAGFSFFEGVTIGPFIQVLNVIDPSIVRVALLGTLAIFTCFSAAALLSARRSYLYLGATLGSVLSMLCFLSFFNMFAMSEALFNLQLYVGLFMFLGYIVFDTQMVVEQASMGDGDFVGHAVKLYTDLVAVFIRIAAILAKNSNRKRERN